MYHDDNCMNYEKFKKKKTINLIFKKKKNLKKLIKEIKKTENSLKIKINLCYKSGAYINSQFEEVKFN